MEYAIYMDNRGDVTLVAKWYFNYVERFDTDLCPFFPYISFLLGSSVS